jgi:hypothetical protein
MSEANLWTTIRTKMLPDYWSEATRHEDAYQKGIADVSFVQLGRHGWMELKWVARYPVRESTVVRIPHYTDEQRAFLRAKGSAGGMTFLFMKIERDYLLFDHLNAPDVGMVTASELRALASCVMSGKFDPEKLFKAIEENMYEHG